MKEGWTERRSECIVLYYNGISTRSLLQDLSEFQMEICEVDHQYLIILDKWIVTSNLIGRRVSCDESLFSDNDSVRVGCSNDNAMTTIDRGVWEERMMNRM